jgi:2-polyprenyl-3-methyl-5-hydroxy-6-metoxy-1,4-benzoquinol methylase
MHLVAAAKLDPRSVTSFRFLRSFVHAGNTRPTYADARSAMEFIASVLQPPHTRNRAPLTSRAALVTALYTLRATPAERVLGFIRILPHTARLLRDKELHRFVLPDALVKRHRAGNMIDELEHTEGSEVRVQARNTTRARTKRSPWFEEHEFQYGGRLTLKTIDPTDSHGKMLTLLKPGQRLLETGCANGRFSGVLNELGCTVVGVEIDPNAAAQAAKVCDQVIIGNLEDTETLHQIPGGFDVILFGDVLEHMVQPWEVLRSLRDRLNPEGYLVVSLPNVAHWDVRMGLLRGRFDYQRTGLLDATHLRFFTRRTAYELIEESGYKITKSNDSFRLPMWVYSVRLVRRFAPKLILPMLARLAPNLFTYQFVFKAIPVSNLPTSSAQTPSEVTS